MTTETPTAEPFDAFEQRLAAALAAEADTVAAPADGRSLIEARLAHRRRTRRATWFAAAAALVLIAGIVGVALRSTDQGSAPYVDTDTGGMPLLGFGDSDWGLFQYAPGMSYFVSDARATEAATTTHNLQVVNRRSDLGDGAFIWAEEESTSVGGRTVRLGTLTTDDGEGYESSAPAAWWDAGGGWTATVRTDGDGTPETERAELLAAAAAVVEVPRIQWEQRLTGASGSVPSFGEPMLVLEPGAGGTQLIAISGNAVTAWLTPDVDGLPDAALSALAPSVERDYLDEPDRVTVRGLAGSYSAGRGNDRAQLLWVEDDQAYVIAAEGGATVEQLTRMAELLVVPTADAWRRLVYPDGPRDFPDADYFRVDPRSPSTP